MNFQIPTLSRLITTLPGILIAITCHEFAHAYSAYRLGDPTAKEYGRLSLNPFKHIDPLGFLLLMLAGFGWAKPVPYNPNYFENRRAGNLIVSIAGIVTNLVLAVCFTLLFGLQVTYFNNQLVENILLSAIGINVGLAIFNLLPFPPLDGSKLILSFLSEKAEYYYYRYQRYFQVALLLLIVFNIIDLFMVPAANLVMSGLSYILLLFF